jgi:hypothetical protein
MGWFRVSDGQVAHGGHVSRDPFAAWIATPEGAAAIAAVAAGMRFKLLGKTRAARKQVWRELLDALRSADGRAALQASADLYIRSLISLAYAQALPRATVALHRLVLVPRALVAERARAAIAAQLDRRAAFASLSAAQREFLYSTIMSQIDEGMRAAGPTLQKPLKGHEGWVVIGADTRFEWVDRYWSGDGWTGHWFLYELPRTRLSRADRKAVDSALQTMRTSIENLPRERRHALVKVAASC